MVSRRGLVTRWLALPVVLVAGTVSPTLGAREPVRFALIVAKDSPISDLAFYDLRRLYQGEAINANGRRLTPLNFPTKTENRQRFDQAVLGLAPDAVSRYWIDRRIRGQSGPPKSIDSADLMQRVVARLDGGIGYVRLSEVRPDVKVLRIDGKAPKDSGYRVEF
jgi:hypothetical protein